MNRWISSAEEQPSERGRYLAYHYYMDSIHVCYWDGNKWEHGHNITHWMNLPHKPRKSDAIVSAMQMGVLVDDDLH